MAYDEYLADRIKHVLHEKKISFEAKKMMGGLCFMVNDKMCCAIYVDKKSGDNLLMARIGEAAYEKEISKETCLPINFTGKPMKGYLFVTPDGIDTEDDLTYWIQLCINFNPLAKSNKKKVRER